MNRQPQRIDRIRTHVVTELPLYLHEWERYLHGMESQDCITDEALLVQLAGFSQTARGMVRLLLLPLSEVCALCMEALLTFSLCGGTRYDPPLHDLMRRGCRCLCEVFVLYGQGVEPSSEKVASLRCELFEVARLLLLGMEETVRRAYDGPCVVYPVRRSDRHDPSPLRVRGFDLLRVEREGLNMYLLDYAWDDVLERGSGVGGLLGFLARNGHVFDVRSLSDERTEQGDVLRLVFASPLDQDFVEALTRIPSECVHVINCMRLRRYESSWQVRQVRTISPRASAPGRSLEDLIAAYDAAMDEQFAVARAERDQALARGSLLW